MEAISLLKVSEPGVTHHVDPTKEDSRPEANGNGSRRRKKRKKKEEALCEEDKALDVSDQMHPPKNHLSNIAIQEDSSQQGQDSCENPEAAQHCKNTVVSAQEDSQSGAIDMTSSERKKKRRKKKKDKDTNALRENGVDTNSEVTMECDARHNSEAQGPKLKSTEENIVNSTVVNGCLESKDDTVDQQKGADVKAGDSVSETQNPKAKKKKRRKTKTMEVCDALESTLATSIESGPVECMETAGVCEVKSKKRKRKKKSLTDQETADMEVCDPSENTLLGTIESGSVECLLDHSNKEILESCDKNTGQELVGEDRLSKTEKSATEVIYGVQNPGTLEEKTKYEIGEPKQKRKKKNKKSCEDHKTDTMDAKEDDVSLPRNEGDLEKRKKTKKKTCEDHKTDNMDAKKDDDSVPRSEGELEKRKKKKKKKKSCEDHKTDNMDVKKNDDYVPRSEGELEKRKKKKKKKSCEDHKSDNMDAKKDDDSVPRSEGELEKREKKKKKKKSSEDHKTDNMDAKKDDVSLPRNEGELEFDGEKLDTLLSSSVLINDNMAQGVASQETGDLPRCSCKGQSTRKLIVFDLNGILADIVQGNTGEVVPDGRISLRAVFKRPFVASFLDFCFERFDVGIWSSRRIGLNYMTDLVMGNHARNLLFSFGQSICITTKFKTLENTTKPIFLKDLRRVWNRIRTCRSCGKRKYDQTNTLLVDDSPDKALCNPPYTGIFPFPYQYTDREDSALGPDGELRKYMERLVDAENVQKFVEENPIGQSAITETHQSWSFYSRVIKAYKK